MNEIHFLGQRTNLMELSAMLTGIAGVWLTIRENTWCFPVRLYADALLQCIYVFLLLFGWVRWANKNKGTKAIHPVIIKPKIKKKLLIIFVLSTFIMAVFLQEFTLASYPWLDSALTCSSLIAQWMIAKKHIENWIVWIVVDIIYIPLYIVKNLPLTAFLYFIFLLLALNGYREWKKKLMFHET
jgi:nicotinamide mononucleotide transporter